MRRRHVFLKYLSIALVFYLCVAVYYNNDEWTQSGFSMENEPALPDHWTPSREIKERIAHRRHHVFQVCQRYLEEREPLPQKLNAREFLINDKFGLIWCNVFKAASSSWLWNFNLMAGFTEEQIISHGELLAMAREVYHRPNPETLKKAMNESPQALSLIITRHPFARLVSAYRNKIASGNMKYHKLIVSIIRAHPELGNYPLWLQFLFPWRAVPTFSQFVQYILDRHRSGRPLNEHWVPMSEHCTPCLANFTVIAKVETLKEDAYYIIFTSGIQGVVKPRMINKSPDKLIEDVTHHYMCQLSSKQILGLTLLYKYDFELFEYDPQQHLKCNQKSELVTW